MDSTGDQEMMEAFHYYHSISPPPPSSSWAVAGETSSPPLHSSKERKRGDKRGSGVKLSTDPQSVAARERRHRISDRFRVLKSLVPGGSKMDTVSMLEEAIHYVKFLKAQIWLHQAAIALPRADHDSIPAANSFPPAALTTPGASIYTTSSASTCSSSSTNMVAPHEQMFGYAMPPLPPTDPLPPFPCCSLQGEEEMVPYNYVGFNY